MFSSHAGNTSGKTIDELAEKFRHEVDRAIGDLVF